MEEKGKKIYKQRYFGEEEIDPETGEVLGGKKYSVIEQVDGYHDLKLPKKKYLNNGDFVILFQNTMYRIATEAKLTKNEMQILLYLLGTAGFDNSISLDLDTLSEKLDVKKPNISTALKGLLKRNIIIKREVYRGTQKTKPFELLINYDQLNYGVTWKGDFGEHKKIKMKHPEIEPCPQSLLLPKTDPNQLKFDFFGEENNEIDPDILETIKEENEKLDKLHKERKRLIDRLNELKDKNMEWAGENFYIDEFGNPSFRGKSPYEKEIKEINEKLENFLN